MISDSGMNILQNNEIRRRGREGRLSSRLTVEHISVVLGFTPDRADCSDGKINHEWLFVADRAQCAIWDYRNVRWSCSGPASCFRALFGDDYRFGADLPF
jgi:hypothetical protein